MKTRRILIINAGILVAGLGVAEMIPFLLCRNTSYAPSSLGTWLSLPFIFTQTKHQAFMFWGVSVGAFTAALVLSIIWVKARWLSYTVTALWMVYWALAVLGALIAGMIG